jgi:2-succinyl-5-enolpyruvyl-6-hydroxy-3-cyclohexene-1-carboxylate synthase
MLEFYDHFNNDIILILFVQMTNSDYQKLIDFFSVLKSIGIMDAIISPGSRNAPLIRSLNQLKFDMHSVVDERSAGFMAMGMAKAGNLPTLLCCTSGTAVLNYYPAIAEAFFSRVPILVITADRPFAQIDQWEGQAIRQNGVFASHVRYQCLLSINKNKTNANLLGIELSEVMRVTIPGPIHINIPLEEPLYSFDEETEKKEILDKQVSVSTNELVQITKNQIEKTLVQDWTDKKILFFQGMDFGENLRFEILNDPILSDVTSRNIGNVKKWDALLHTSMPDHSRLENLQPDVLVTLGTTTVSKGLKSFLRAFPPKEHFHISRYDEVGRMFNTKPQIVDVERLNREVDDESFFASKYLESWLSAESEFNKDLLQLPWEKFTAFSATKLLLERLPNDCVVHAANSMAIRYASFLNIKPVISNRGTSGIDGCTSTTVGYSIKSDLQQVLITGDLAFLYDINGLWLESQPKNLKIAVINNGGGGIFNLIDGPKAMGDSKVYQVTPHQRNIKSLAAHFGIDYLCATGLDELNNALTPWLENEGASILEIKTSGKEDQNFYKLFNNLR